MSLADSSIHRAFVFPDVQSLALLLCISTDFGDVRKASLSYTQGSEPTWC